MSTVRPALVDVDEDRSLCLDSSVATGWTSSDRYCAADPLRHRYVRLCGLWTENKRYRSILPLNTRGSARSRFCDSGPWLFGFESY